MIEDRLEALDTSLFEIDAELGPDDRRTLLALGAACRHAHGSYTYLEIGSHLGGSLQTFMRDPSCTAAISIDPRPSSQPDERGQTFAYRDNSTERMIENLARLDGVDLEKLVTFEQGTDTLAADDLPTRPQLAFIDGEHTDLAALRDGLFCLDAMPDGGCVAFHDAPIVHIGLERFLGTCRERDVAFSAVALPNRIFVVEVGPPRLLQHPAVAAQVRDSYRAYLKALQEFEQYRSDYRRGSRRVLRQVERVLRAARRGTG